MKRYLIQPGYVISRNDGDPHYIGAAQLASLYGVRPSECYVEHGDERDRGLPDGLIPLGPRFDGDYVLPDA